MSLLLLLFFITLDESSGLSPLEYDPHKGSNLTDSEKYNDVNIPKDKYKFKSFTEGATYVGILFAGKSEFPWIVDLRVHDAEPEDWSTGNLVSAKHVLTTCRAVRLLQDFGGRPDVTYFMQYVWEHTDYGLENPGNEWPERLGGRRRIDYVILHHKCKEFNNERTLSYDIGSIVLQDPVAAALPYIGYMPIATDQRHPHKIRHVNLEKIETLRKICLVGSVGRSYVNVKDHLVKDYKVRFRVYWETWETCSDMMDKLCDSHRYDCTGMYPKSEEGRDWVCMRSRARVGTVCDHDRGAPLICGDEVVGIVVFGALLDYCNDRFPMSFVVAKLSQFQHFILKRVNNSHVSEI